MATNFGLFFMQEVVLANLEQDLLILDNRVRFTQGVVEEKIKWIRKGTELLYELKEKKIAPVPKNKVEELVAGATDAVETEENSEGGGGDYDYLLKGGFGAFTRETLAKLSKGRDKLKGKVNEAKEATPMSLWKDLDALDKELDAQDHRDAVAEASRLEIYKKRMNSDGPIDTASDSAMETVHEGVNLKGKAGPKKAPTRREVDVPKKQATKKPPIRKNVAGKKTSLAISGGAAVKSHLISKERITALLKNVAGKKTSLAISGGAA